MSSLTSDSDAGRRADLVAEVAQHLLDVDVRLAYLGSRPSVPSVHLYRQTDEIGRQGLRSMRSTQRNCDDAMFVPMSDRKREKYGSDEHLD